VVVIRHWRVHNRVRKDTYRRTLYYDEYDMLSISSEGVYNLIEQEEKINDKCVSVTEINKPVTENNKSVTENNKPVTQDRIGKDREVKDSIVEGSKGEGIPPAPIHQNKRELFPPSFETVEKYCKERGNKIDAKRFYTFYNARDWKIQGEIMADWRACIKGWEKTEYKRPPPNNESIKGEMSFDSGEFFDAAINRSYRNLNIRT
jgi:hypothetical protein